MAGEIEDCISLQADSLPTGSISFGRFELESLSWERRSSFSHNRYLEEVEKYSTPGSVTQKKAYFEAHFKKKALERQASSVSHNGVDWQATENGIEDHVNYTEEYVEQGYGEQRKFAWNDETPAVANEQEHDVMESTGGQLQFSWYDETSPAASDEDEFDVIESNEGQLQFVQYDEARAISDEHQHNVIDCEQEADNSPSEIPEEPMLCNDMKVLDYPIELVKHDEILQSQSRYDTTQSDKDCSITGAEQKTENGSVNVGELLEKCDISSKSSIVEKDNAASFKKTQNGYLNVKSTVEEKSLKAKLWTPVPVSQTTRKTSTEKNSLSSGKAFNRSLRKKERENTLRTKTEKQLSLKVSPSTFSDSKNLKPEDSESLKAQARQDTGSGKGLGAKKDGARPRSISGNGETIAGQSTNRARKDVYSTKAEIKQSSSAFNFKSDERVEKRKEFYMRLEEKLHAKELEMNEIQARTQIETEAEIKQFRRSLNFKATPMPSFYHGAVPRDSNGKKMVVTPAKCLKLRSKSKSPGGKAAPQANSTIPKAVDSEVSSSSEPVSSTHAECPTASEGDPSCLIVANRPDKIDEPSNGDQVSQPAKKVVAGKNKERGKPMVQQQQGEIKAKKGERASMGRRGGVRKVMKGIVGRSVAVHVAS